MMSDPSGAAVERRPSITVVLMGVAGAGKSRIMAAVGELVAVACAEGDAFHSAANIAAMRSGTPLSDEDRWPWLRSIADWIGAQERGSTDALVTCSALRRSYRDYLRDGHPTVIFVELVANPAVLARRLEERTGHYMPARLLASQLATFEPLEPDEPGFTLDAEGEPSAIAAEIVDRVWARER